MNGAVGAVRAAVLAVLRADPLLDEVLNGVFDGPAVRASAPFAEVGEAMSSDWSTKDQRGREVRIAVLIRDLAERPARLASLIEAAERAVAGLPRDLDDGWQVASCVFLRARTAGEGPGRWLAVAEWRVRVLENQATVRPE